MRIVRAERVYDAGKYHAWTDIAFFCGHYYMAFRTGTMHTSNDGYVEVLRSEDATVWTPCLKSVFSLGNETSCGMFLATPEKLFLYLGVAQTDMRTGRNERTSFVYWTEAEDGNWWRGGPKRYLPAGYVPWYPKRREDLFYVTAYHQTSGGEGYSGSAADLFVSPNGVDWDRSCTISDENGASEAAIEFEEDGRIVALVRHDLGEKHATFHEARSPGEEWKVIPVGQHFGGPTLFRWKKKLICITRYHASEAPVAPLISRQRTGVFVVENGQFEHVLDLPWAGGGDSGYPGIVQMDSGNLLVSYYSGAEFTSCPSTRYRRSAIYIAELEDS